MTTKPKIILVVFFLGAALALTAIIVYVEAFRTIGHAREVNILTVERLGRTPHRKSISLRGGSGWQVRTDVLQGSGHVVNGAVVLKFRNLNRAPLSVVLNLNPDAVSALSSDFSGYNGSLKEGEVETVYAGNVADLNCKPIRLSSSSSKTAFEISVESLHDEVLNAPVRIYAYMPADTL